MKVALLQCPVWGTREPPLAVVQLAGCLKACGHEVRSFDLNNFLYRKRNEGFKNLWAWEQSFFWYQKDEVRAFFSDHAALIDGYADDVLAFDPRAVGFSIGASSLHASVAFAGVLRRKKPQLKIIFGGTVFYDRGCIDRAFAESPADFVIAGEADVTFPELVRAIERGADIAACSGVHLREGDRARFTGERPLMKNLDALPYMDFSDLRPDDYDDSEHLLVMASRGCVWNCAFCSSQSFWHGYRTMSGERIHQEITYQRMRHRKIGHIDFADLAFNGDMDRVRDFCRLIIDYPPYPSDFKIYWQANAVITSKLTPEMTALMKQAGCKRLLFGIESGSERVLRLMRKAYRPEVARKVVRDVAEAGIAVTCNFMFGFPGETEEDFQETLAFVKDVAPYIDRAYPSRTYCALEEYSYFYEHPEEFGIRTPFNHHLYWETVDGSNTYPVRLERCRRFEALCGSLGVRIDCGVNTTVELDNWMSLGMYYEYKKDYAQVLACYVKYLALDPHNKVVVEKVRQIAGRDDIPADLKGQLRQYLP